MTLNEYKAATGKTDAELAADFGLERSQLTKIRTGLRVPSLACALEIARLSDGKVPVDSWSEQAA